MIARSLLCTFRVVLSKGHRLIGGACLSRMLIRHDRCVFWYYGSLVALVLWSIAALKYISLPVCIIPSEDQCLSYYSLSRETYPLTNKRLKSELLINRSKFHSWSAAHNIDSKCCRIIFGDHCALREVKHVKPWNEDLVYAQFNSCASVQAELYNNYYVSKEELSSPIAYIALVHKEPHMLLRFLKSVYRRHNAYCVHYDQKSSPHFKSFIHLLSKCIDNVIIPKRIEDITWGDASILNAQLNCFRELLAYHSIVPWKYAFNLQGHELPLRTNRELVEMLRSQPPNTSIMESWPITDRVDQERLTYQIRTFPIVGNLKAVSLSSEKLKPLPSDLELEIFKSWCFIAATPHFVRYMLEANVSKILAKFLQNVGSAEEYFYATLYNHKLTPGGRHGSSRRTNSVDYEPPFAVSVSLWLHGVVNRHKYCGGLDYHGYCHFSVRDLKSIFNLYVNGKLIEPFPVNNLGYGDSPNFVAGTKKAMFLNKYMTDTDPNAMDCLEKRLSMQNMLEYYFDHKV